MVTLADSGSIFLWSEFIKPVFLKKTFADLYEVLRFSKHRKGFFS
jgi:hypothetical protein